MTSGVDHIPTEGSRGAVEGMKRCGITHEGIARVLEISDDTLVKYYKNELDTAVDKAIVAVAGSLYRRAIDDNHPGSTTSAIFWLKTRGRWKEASELEIKGTLNVVLANYAPTIEGEAEEVKMIGPE